MVVWAATAEARIHATPIATVGSGRGGKTRSKGDWEKRTGRVIGSARGWSNDAFAATCIDDGTSSASRGVEKGI